MDCLLALDVGTSSFKAALYDLSGKLLARESAAYAVSSPHPGWVEQDPQDWWEACSLTCSKIVQNRQYRVLAVSVSGQAPGCIPIDRAGAPVRPAILWLDRRAAPQVNWLKEQLAHHDHLQPGLNLLDSYFGGVKWLWYRQNELHNYAATWKIMQANGFIIHRLTGEAVIDLGHAGICSPCFDAEKQAWSPSLCDLMDIDLEKLPAIHPAGEIIGSVTKQAAQATGLPAGTPVICGSADFVCSYLGSGASGGSTASIMLGTAGNLMFLAPARIDTRMLNTIYFTGEVLSTGGVLAGGAVNWFLNMLNTDDPDLLAALDRETAVVEPGAQGLIFLPYLMGERSPIWDPQARGVYMGLSTLHQRGHLYRALLEGVAYAFRQLVDILKENGAHIDEAVVINGGSRSSLWRQIIADVLEIPLHYRPSTDGTSLGGAFLAGMGAGVFKRFDQIGSWLEAPVDSFPNPENGSRYRRNFAVYAGLYEKLKDSFQALQTG